MYTYIPTFFISKNEIFTCVLLLFCFVLVDMFLLSALCKILSSLLKWEENRFILCTLKNSFNSGQKNSKVRSIEVIQIQYIQWQRGLKLQSHVLRWKGTHGYLICKNFSRGWEKGTTWSEHLVCEALWQDLAWVLCSPPIQRGANWAPGRLDVFIKSHLPEIHSLSLFCQHICIEIFSICQKEWSPRIHIT